MTDSRLALLESTNCFAVVSTNCFAVVPTVAGDRETDSRAVLQRSALGPAQLAHRRIPQSGIPEDRTVSPISRLPDRVRHDRPARRPNVPAIQAGSLTRASLLLTKRQAAMMLGVGAERRAALSLRRQGYRVARHLGFREAAALTWGPVAAAG
jgi:hypothetical protein